MDHEEHEGRNRATILFLFFVPFVVKRSAGTVRIAEDAGAGEAALEDGEVVVVISRDGQCAGQPDPEPALQLEAPDDERLRTRVGLADGAGQGIVPARTRPPPSRVCQSMAKSSASAAVASVNATVRIVMFVVTNCLVDIIIFLSQLAAHRQWRAE